jgi:4-hydroxybenzoate polyprenyltransferase
MKKPLSSMAKLRDYLDLIRWKQVIFKNSIIVIPLIFSIGKFPAQDTLRNVLFIFLGFIALALMSSFNYINNDLTDIEKDKNHPEKKNRPIASGRIAKKNAFTFSIFLLLISIILASLLSYYSSWYFLACVIFLFFSSLFYSSYFREIVFLDIIIISINFVVRATSGIFLIENGEISYWMILCTFFLSLFLVASKRVSEMELRDIKNYRKNYENVNKNFMLILVAISISCVLIFFCIYSILFGRPILLISLPIAMYTLLLYFNAIYSHPEQIRNPEIFIFSKKTAILILLWIAIAIAAFVF